MCNVAHQAAASFSIMRLRRETSGVISLAEAKLIWPRVLRRRALADAGAAFDPD